MSKPSDLVEKHINSSPDFAKPICIKIRDIIFKAVPDISESWKWGGPVYHKEVNICGFRAFKHHVSLFFFQGAHLSDTKKILSEGVDNLNSRYLKFRSVDEVNEKILISYIREASKLKSLKKIGSKPELEIPAEMLEVLNRNKDLKKMFDNLPYTHRKEYIQYIRDARKEETRIRRLEKIDKMIRDVFVKTKKEI